MRAATGRTRYARGARAQYHQRMPRVANAAVHSEFSLGTYAKVKMSGTPRSAARSGTRGTEGRGLHFVSESRREEDGIAIVHEPKPKQYLITMRVAALCHEARMTRRRLNSNGLLPARTTHAAAEVPRADVAPASMPRVRLHRRRSHHGGSGARRRAAEAGGDRAATDATAVADPYRF